MFDFILVNYSEALMEPLLIDEADFILSTKAPAYFSQEKTGYDQIRENGPKRTHIIVKYFFMK